MSDDPSKKLDRARAMFRRGDEEAQTLVYELAGEKYAPARDLIDEMLESADENWRETALSAIVDWDDWTPETFARVGEVLRNDPAEGVRMRAAGILGGVPNTWPDVGLQHALDHDPSSEVRTIAFESALLLMGMPWPDVQSAASKVRGGDVEPNLANALAAFSEWQSGKTKKPEKKAAAKKSAAKKAKKPKK